MPLLSAKRVVRGPWALLFVLVIGAALRLIWLDRVPPGLYFDEAAYGDLALEVLRGERPIFFSAYTGREPMFIYAVAGAIALLGQSPLAIRIVAALAGVLAIGATYWAAWLLFDRAVAIIGAGLLAVSFWPVFTSRLGYRADLVPLFAALAVACFWRAAQRNRCRDYVVAGTVLGLSLYTYPSARALPAVFAAFLLGQLALDASWCRQRWRGLALYWLAAAIAFAPLGWYFLQHPSDFTERLQQATAFREDEGAANWVETLWQHGTRTLGMFSFLGDESVKYNLPGRPVFDPPLAALFYLGLLLAVRRLGHPSHRLLVTWLVVMLVPGMLSIDSPHFIRTLGAAPPAHILPGLGLVVLGNVAARLRPSLLTYGGQKLKGALGAACVLALAGQTGHLYFDLWGKSTATFIAMMGDVAEAARAVEDLPANASIFFATADAPHPTVAYLAPRNYDAIRWFAPRDSFVLAPPGEKVYYAVPAWPAPSAAEPYLSMLPVYREGYRPDGSLSFRIYELGPTTPRPHLPTGPPVGQVGDILRVHGAVVPELAPAGQELTIAISWEVLRAPNKDVSFSVRLTDDNGEVWAQRDGVGYPSRQWRPGEMVVSLHRLRVPETAPPFKGHITLAVYDARSLAPIDVDQDGSIRPQLRLGSVRVLRPPSVAESSPRGLAVAPGLLLLKADLPASTVYPGSPMRLRLVWQAASGERPSRVVLGLHGLDRGFDAEMAAQVVSDYPATEWRLGEVVEQRLSWVLPPALPPGLYGLTVAAPPGTPQQVGQLQVYDYPRQFFPPLLEYRDGRVFAGKIVLLGYNLRSVDVRAGSVIDLQLAWQALGQIGHSYKVFVHLIDGVGSLKAQHDKYPDDGRRPTTSWLIGEVLTDNYRIPVPDNTPAGEYQLAVGWYEEATGHRLLTDDGQDHITLDARIRISR